MERRRPKVLTVSYGGSHSKLMAPVVRELRARNQVDVVALALTTGARVYDAAGVECRGYRHYVDWSRDHTRVSLGRRLLQDVDGESAGVCEEETVAYMGSCMADLIAEIGEREAWERYERLGRHAFLPRRTVGHIIDVERPDVVAVTNAPKSERAAVLEGIRRGITTVLIPDHFAIREEESYAPFEAEWYGAMCDITRKHLVEEHGARLDRVVVTGQPAFDKCFVKDVLSCRRYAAEHVWPSPVGDFIVVATGPDNGVLNGRRETSRTHSVSVVRTLLQAADEIADFRFVVKPHPSESEGAYRELVAGHPRFSVAERLSNIDMLLRASRGLVAAVKTTALLDAMALDVPALRVKVDDGADRWPYESMHVPVVRSLDELTKKFRALLFDADLQVRQRDARRAFRKMNEGAAGKLATLMTQLAVRRMWRSFEGGCD